MLLRDCGRRFLVRRKISQKQIVVVETVRSVTR